MLLGYITPKGTQLGRRITPHCCCAQLGAKSQMLG
jgi:hypothetical protein